MTAQIASAIQEVHCSPRGVAVMIEAEHMCMAMRGIRKSGSMTTDDDIHRHLQGPTSTNRCVS